MPKDELTALVGANVRMLRAEAGVTLDAVARAGRSAGLKWSTARVRELEQGQHAMTAATMMMLPHVMSEAIGRRVSLAELFQGAQAVQLTPSISVTPEALQEVVSGRSGGFRISEVSGASVSGGAIEKLADSKHILEVGYEAWTAAKAGSGLADERAASRLGVTPDRFLVLAIREWGHSLTQERDRRVPRGSSAQHRGQVTRRLEDEIRSRAVDAADE